MSRKPKPKPSKPKGDASSPMSPPDRVVEIERLAALDPVDYDVARAEGRPTAWHPNADLDGTVAKKRRALGLETGEGDDGQGRAVKMWSRCHGPIRWTATRSRQPWRDGQDIRNPA